jgi:pimeloyl-ACP methyl ester carboxylesterase
MADNTTAPCGVLVWLVGGPGEPGVGLTAVITHQFDPAVLHDYRLVMISTRGTGTSALQCPQLQQVMRNSDQTVPPPSAVQACARSIGADRRFYTTADTVADLDTLRQALRVNTLTLDGASYGTFVAERYAITHPDRVSRLVLDSVVPHDTFDPLEIAAFNRTAQVPRMVCAETRCSTDPARGDDSALDAIIAAETRNQATSVEQLSQGLHAATVCADFVWPWGDADTPVLGQAGATTKAVAALSDAAVFPYDRATAAGTGVVVTCEQPQLKTLFDDWLADRPTGLRSDLIFLDWGRPIPATRVDRALTRIATAAGIGRVTTEFLTGP